MASPAVSHRLQSSFSIGKHTLTCSKEKGAHDVNAVVRYLKVADDGSEPAPSYVGKPETYDQPAALTSVTITDISGLESNYTLDDNGFQLVDHESQEKDFLDEDEIRNVYYPEIEQLLKQVSGASRVYIFDHTIRRNSKDDRTPAADRRGPVQRVHIDQSYRASRDRVKYHLPDEAPELLKGRVQIINVWRPIETILKDPLGIADASTVSDDDLVPIKLIYPDRVGETYGVKPNSCHKWFYRYGQTPDLVTLIKCYDSKQDGRARRVPHTAFTNPETESAPPRQSIEVRALVFHPDDTT